MMIDQRRKMILYVSMAFITLVTVFPFLWMMMLSFKPSTEIIRNPMSWPQSFDFHNYINALATLNLPRMYFNTFTICILAIIIQLTITFLSSFVLARMEFNKNIKNSIYSFLILGLTISPFILLFPVFRINLLVGMREKAGLLMPYVATSISFNTLLLVGFMKGLPKEIDEAALIDGCNLWQLMFRVILPVTKPVIATVIIFNVLYIWNEYPFASIMLRNIENYTLSMGAAFFRGKFSVDYGGIIASSVMIIIPQLIFYGLFQKNIVDGITTGAVKG